MNSLRVLHVLHHSLPLADGYAIRSRYVLTLQQVLGWQVGAVTSAQHVVPELKVQPAEEQVEGIPHYRTQPAGHRLPLLREWKLMRALRARLGEVIPRWRPDVIHVHSPVLCSLPALWAAGRIPVVYEIRDLWENASVDRGKFAYGSARYRLAQRLENHALTRAGAVVTICEALRGEIAGRCPSISNLHVVPNGVDIDRFRPAAPDTEAARRWNPEGAPLLAYIGAFQAYEGLDILLRGFRELLRERPAARLLVVGGGPEDANLRRLAVELGLGDRAVFTGRVPHEEVGSIYSIADVLVYPRRTTRTTALTTPLKPLEALALKKAVLASDVQAVQELIRHEETGLLFRADDPQALADGCRRLLDDAPLRARLGEAGRTYVERERQWRGLVRGYADVYAPLVAPRLVEPVRTAEAVTGA